MAGPISKNKTAHVSRLAQSRAAARDPEPFKGVDTTAVGQRSYEDIVRDAVGRHEPDHRDRSASAAI